MAEAECIVDLLVIVKYVKCLDGAICHDGRILAITSGGVVATVYVVLVGR